MLFDNSPKGFGSDSSDNTTPNPTPRKLQKPRHHFDRDVVRPEVYNNSIQSRFDSPGRRNAMQERIKALGLTDNDVRRLRSHHKVEAFICLGSDSPIRLIDLLYLNEPELRSVYLEATEARKYQSNQLDRYQEMLTQAATTFEKDNLIKSMNTVQTVLGLYCSFENTARDIIKCPKTARQTLLGELKEEKDADPSIYQQHKEMREKLGEVRSERNELRRQVKALTAELEEAKKNTSTVDPVKHDEFQRRLCAIHQLTSGIDLGDDRVSDVLPAVIEDCKRYPGVSDVVVESGKIIHSSYACRAIALEFLKQRQKDNVDFCGEENGKFNHGDVMQFLADVVEGKFKFHSPWQYAANDLDLQPCGTKTYISDRLSTALGLLVSEGLLVRKAKGSHTLWAKTMIDF